MPILTTHVGSLPRSKAVTDLIFAAERGEALDTTYFDAVMGAAVDEAVTKQVAAGSDLVSHGERAFGAFVRRWRARLESNQRPQD